MTNHQKISYLKSGVRLVGYLALLTPSFVGGVLLLVLAEFLGIVEEIGQDYGQ